MKIDPFGMHPLVEGIPNKEQRLVRTKDVFNAIEDALHYNFETRADDAPSYVAVDNTLRLLKHTLEDLVNESR